MYFSRFVVFPFSPTITVQDFSIRGHQVFLHIKRRRWLNIKTGKLVKETTNELQLLPATN
ncbi:hypothetical protein EXU85_02895 [Spirosoma sp. KCTC 42546]|nr:hypothetical protein EXU85_02895 [Spirosoma sp. KCTC 42546]